MTSASPADDSGWVLCEAVVQANAHVKTTGLTQTINKLKVSFNVSYAEGTNPASATATVSNTNGYKETVQLAAGTNTISLPSKEEFTIKPDSYKYNDTNYEANTLTVIDGKFKDMVAV